MAETKVETRAGITWKCRFDSMFYGGMAHDCGHDIGPNECGEYRARCNAEPHICTPVAEAREFLGEVISAMTKHNFEPDNYCAEIAKARALLAVLPEEEW